MSFYAHKYGKLILQPFNLVDIGNEHNFVKARFIYPINIDSTDHSTYAYIPQFKTIILVISFFVMPTWQSTVLLLASCSAVVTAQLMGHCIITNHDMLTFNMKNTFCTKSGNLDDHVCYCSLAVCTAPVLTWFVSTCAQMFTSRSTWINKFCFLFSILHV